MLIYRDDNKGHRLPAWLERAPNVCRRASFAGDLLAIGDPIYLDEPAGAVWHALPDQWSCCLTGDFRPQDHLRLGAEAPDLLPIQDASGRAWHAPAVLTPDVSGPGTIALALPWSRSADGVIERQPREDQRPLITAARGARAEILAGKLAQVPIAVAAEWAATLLAGAYHIPREAILALFLDDRIVVQVLMASAGLVRPRGD